MLWLNFKLCPQYTAISHQIFPILVCEDITLYADICPSIASCGNYCNDHKVWAQKNCPKSCKMCPGNILLNYIHSEDFIEK